MSAYEDLVLSLNPIGYWRLGEAPASTQAVDISGNGKDLTVQGTVEFGAAGLITADDDTAAQFPGNFQTDYLERSFDIDLAVAAPISIVAWVKANVQDPNQVLDMLANNKGYEIVTAGADPKRWQARFGDGTGSPYTGEHEVVPGEVVCIVATNDGTTTEVWINGKAESSRTSGYTPSDTEPFKIGHDFDGTIDEVAVFDYVLSDDEKEQIWVVGSEGEDAGPPLTETLTWVDAEGTEYPLEGASVLEDDGHFVRSTEGMFMPPVNVVEDLNPIGPGSILRHIELGPREIAVGLYTEGDDRAEHLARLRALIAALDPTRGDGRLVVAYSDGITREIVCRYVGGLELVQDGQQGGQVHQTAILIFRAFDPYWRDAVETFISGAHDQVTTSELQFPATGEALDQGPSGGVMWKNPGNITAEDALVATATLGKHLNTKQLRASNFGFVIPAGATIRGIVVEIKRGRVLGPPIADTLVQLDIGNAVGDTVGQNKAKTDQGWFRHRTVETYGSPTDLWGYEWTDAAINAATFGVRLRARKRENVPNNSVIECEFIRATVHYTTTSGKGFSQEVVVNLGDTEAWPVWTIRGPGSDFEVINHETDRRLKLSGVTLTEDESIEIDTRPGAKSVLQSDTGASLFANLTADSELFPLERGPQSIAVYATNPDPDTDYEALILSDSPIAYWRLGEPPGSTQADDISGNGKHLTQVGTVDFGADGLVTGFDSAAAFPGTLSDRLERAFDAAINIPGPISIEAWAVGNVDDPNQVIDTLASNKGFEITTAGTPPKWQCRFGSGTGSPFTGTHEVESGEIVHIVATHDGVDFTEIYINGVLDTTRSASAYVASDTEKLQIGNDFDGTIDEVAIYDRVLLPAEVAEHYDAGSKVLPVVLAFRNRWLTS